ncbi:unnamed protein product [Dovyalis caffra]|uniref:Phytocyanin domain-containing protein n=1 Tax=Dovyalis caffra TaxID=77055 RepID=A0AAV1RQX3_9ROSI|nr:unnamed protein product [Dovyalis caffra]
MENRENIWGRREILVGSNQIPWKVPPCNQSLNQWAEENRFKVGDILIWKYDPKKDSVLEVTKEDYDCCNTSKPIKECKENNTKIELNHSGPFYFISGAKGNCEKGEKLEVVVLSEIHWHRDNNNPASVPASASAPAGITADAHGLKGGILGALLGLGTLIVRCFEKEMKKCWLFYNSNRLGFLSDEDEWLSKEITFGWKNNYNN